MDSWNVTLSSGRNNDKPYRPSEFRLLAWIVHRLLGEIGKRTAQLREVLTTAGTEADPPRDRNGLSSHSKKRVHTLLTNPP